MKSTTRCSRALAVVVVMTVVIMLPSTPVVAQTARDASVVLASAQHSELVEGDLRGAIRQYEEVAAMDTADRALVAEALIYMGRSYDRLGDAAARTAYERIVNEFADQREALEFARNRLRVLAPETVGTGVASRRDPTFTLLHDLEDSRFAQVDYSPDGSRFVAVGAKTSGPDAGTPGLFVSDVAGTGLRPLLDDWGLQHFRWPRWSPDGTQIAYHAHIHPNVTTESSVGAIYVVSQDGSSPRQIAPDDAEGGYSVPVWTPSGNITFFSRPDTVFVTVDPAGNIIRKISLGSDENSGLGAGMIGPIAYSPDGRWLVFLGGSQDTRMGFWIIPATGGRAHLLAATINDVGEGRGIGLTWGGDGRSIYVSGLRGTGSDNIRKLTFNPRSGEVVGEHELIASYHGGQIGSLKMLTGGGMAYVVTTLSNHVLVAKVSHPQETVTLARGTAGQVSPDGRTVYYVGEGYGRDGVFAIATAGGDPRRITTTVPAHSRFQLSPDGSTISYHTHLAGQTSMFVLPVQGGEPRLVARTDSGSADTPIWSPDGQWLAFANGGDLFVVPVGGGEPQRIATVKAWETWSIRWSPDGSYLAGFAYVEGEENNAIFVVPANGGELRRLTLPEESEYKEGLEWHPDGQRLSYMNYDPDGSRMAYLDGSPTTLLVNQPGLNWDYTGRWTPDGDTYLFSSVIQGGGQTWWGVYGYDEALERTTEYFAPGLGISVPGSWSRDGRTFVVGKRQVTAQAWLIEDFD